MIILDILIVLGVIFIYKCNPCKGQEDVVSKLNREFIKRNEEFKNSE